MTNNNHPIIPPPELVSRWSTSLDCPDLPSKKAIYIATQAARWGADQELEACCDVLKGWGSCLSPDLHAARRPRPPSLKEQALVLIETVEISQDACSSWDFSVVRRALESLPD